MTIETPANEFSHILFIENTDYYKHDEKEFSAIATTL